MVNVIKTSHNTLIVHPTDIVYLIMTYKMAEFGRPEVLNGSKTKFIMNVSCLDEKLHKSKFMYAHIYLYVSKVNGEQ